MSACGRGRGYTGRHHLREPRPGDSEPDITARTLAEPSARTTDPSKLDKELKPKELDMEKLETQNEEIIKEIKPEVKNQLKEMKPEVKYISSDDDAALKELLTIDEQYTPLLALLEQFSPGEDGIQFNRKLRQFETTVTSMCPDEPSLHRAFCAFRAAALTRGDTARKLAAAGASFTRQQRHQLLRSALLNDVMQGTYCKLDLLERANPLFLINAANLMGDYFSEARLCNGNKVHILAGPLLHYMRALLASDDIRAHRSLATQLMQNGRELLSVLAQELDELSISIRLRLLSPPPASIIWLLLSADLCLNKFLPLPNTLQQFYAAHLDLTADESFSEVSYGSWKKSPEKDGYKSDGSEISADKISQISLNDEDGMKPKLRPILGAGAGLLKQEQAQSVSQDFDTWTSKNSLTKRYDLNSWRQNDGEQKDEEPVFNPSVLPPNLQTFPPITVPDYPPPNVTRFQNYPQENFVNYLQQGDGAYIQNHYAPNSNFNPQGDGFNQTFPQNPTNETFPTTFQQPLNERQPERVNNEVQKSRKPVENWRREKSDLKEDSNKNRQRNWTRQLSKDSVNDDEKDEKFRSTSRNSRDSKPGNKATRRNSSEHTDTGTSVTGKNPSRRHVTDVPRSQKYWDHDDRCDKDYSS